MILKRDHDHRVTKFRQRPTKMSILERPYKKDFSLEKSHDCDLTFFNLNASDAFVKY